MGGFAVIGLVTLPDPHHLQIQKEAFHHRVIPTIAFAAHGAYEAMVFQTPDAHYLCIGRIQPVGMHKKTLGWIALGDTHLQGRAYQRCWHLRGHSPANDLSQMQVQHCRQVQPAAAGAMYAMSHTQARSRLG